MNATFTGLWSDIWIFVTGVVILIGAWFARPQGGRGFNWGVFLGTATGMAIFDAIMFNLEFIRAIGNWIIGKTPWG